MNNEAAIGYMILAAKRIGNFQNWEISILEEGMRSEMDFATEEEAEEAYNKN